jgi:hypothetical protein
MGISVGIVPFWNPKTGNFPYGIGDGGKNPSEGGLAMMMKIFYSPLCRDFVLEHFVCVYSSVLYAIFIYMVKYVFSPYILKMVKKIP